jgi:hypothetical protein
VADNSRLAALILTESNNAMTSVFWVPAAALVDAFTDADCGGTEATDVGFSAGFVNGFAAG